MRKQKGFTLVELVIVIIIVGILSIVAVPIYRGYTRKAMATEGKALLGAIQMAERAYFAENSEYMGTPGFEEASFCEQLDIDARSNKYFTTFSIWANGTGVDAECLMSTSGNGAASGIFLQYRLTLDGCEAYEDGINGTQEK